jgi:hypothetical protein
MMVVLSPRRHGRMPVSVRSSHSLQSAKEARFGQLFSPLVRLLHPLDASPRNLAGKQVALAGDLPLRADDFIAPARERTEVARDHGEVDDE